MELKLIAWNRKYTKMAQNLEFEGYFKNRDKLRGK